MKLYKNHLLQCKKDKRENIIGRNQKYAAEEVFVACICGTCNYEYVPLFFFCSSVSSHSSPTHAMKSKMSTYTGQTVPYNATS